MDPDVPRWAFLRRSRARRAREAAAFVDRGLALRDWLEGIVRDHPHEVAVDLFVEKVIRERIYPDVRWWASEGLDSKALGVFSEGQAKLHARAVAYKQRFLEELHKPRR